MLYPNQKPPIGAVLNKQHPLAKGLIGCWLFNEGSGSRVNDYSGQNKHGTIVNTGAGLPLWQQSPLGIGLYFNGGHYVVTDYLSNQKGTYVVRYYHATYVASNKVLVGNENWTSDRNGIVIAGSYAAYQLYFEMSSAGAAQSIRMDTPIVSMPQKYRDVVCTWDGVQYQTANSRKANTVAAQTVIPVVTVYKCYIGTGADNPTSSTFLLTATLIYHVYAYDRALSEYEMDWIQRAPYDMFMDNPIWMKYSQPTVGGKVPVFDSGFYRRRIA